MEKRVVPKKCHAKCKYRTTEEIKEKKKKEPTKAVKQKIKSVHEYDLHL